MYLLFPSCVHMTQLKGVRKLRFYLCQMCKKSFWDVNIISTCYLDQAHWNLAKGVLDANVTKTYKFCFLKCFLNDTLPCTLPLFIYLLTHGFSQNCIFFSGHSGKQVMRQVLESKHLNQRAIIPLNLIRNLVRSTLVEHLLRTPVCRQKGSLACFVFKIQDCKIRCIVKNLA